MAELVAADTDARMDARSTDWNSAALAGLGWEVPSRCTMVSEGAIRPSHHVAARKQVRNERPSHVTAASGHGHIMPGG
jgi:hypothetical protein